jgi:hypothetical protein
MLAEHSPVLIAALMAACGLFAGAGCGGEEFSAGHPAADARADDASHAPADASFDIRNGERTDSGSYEGRAVQDVADSSMQDLVTADLTNDDALSNPATDAAIVGESLQDRSSSDGGLDAQREPDVTDGGAAGDVSDTSSDTACTMYYRDKDRDGFGATDDHVLACAQPASDDAGAWVVDPGDCRDDLNVVKPDPRSTPPAFVYYGTGYAEPTKPLGVSFDYNCDGLETPDPSNSFGAEPTCPALLTGCAGTGYLPATPSRTGNGIEPHCGSTTLKMCVVQGLGCVTQTVATTAFRCR